MKQSSGSQNNRQNRGIPIWAFILLCFVVFLMALTIAFVLLLHFDIIRCTAKDTLPAQTAAEPTSVVIQEEKQPEHTEPQKPSESEMQSSEPAGSLAQSETPEPASSEVTISEPAEAPATESAEKPASEPAELPAPEPTEAPVSQVAEASTVMPTEAPTTEPTAKPTEKPTPEPTAKPTEKPTPEPTAKPTEKPDYFMFGGKKIKTGETKIDGKKLGINGKNKKLKHITKEEVQDLVTLCPNLEELILEYCYMDDYAPLGKLVKLKKLYLTYCGAGNGNAIKDIGWAEGLTELRTLSLSHNSIDDTKALSGLKKLTYLNISGNPLTDEDLKPLSNLTNLDKLYLYDLKKITDVSPLSKLTKLTFLHIGHNSKLKNVKSLTSLKKLKYLRLNHTKVSDLSYFGKFSALVKLDIAKCPIDTATVKHLKECKKLEKIVLDMGDYDTYNAILDLFTDGYQLHFLYNWSE